MSTLTERIRNGWNAFLNNKDPTSATEYYIGSSYRPDRIRVFGTNERSMLRSVYNRIAIDVAAVPIRHAKLDDQERLIEFVQDGLDDILTLDANIDQTGRAFRQEIVESLFDEGVIALVPVDTNVNPRTGSFEILTMRTGKITTWYPTAVKVEIYNDRTGKREELILSKTSVAIVENPLYSTMNSPNSTYQRLMRKLAYLDQIDAQSSSGKLDLIVQLPYSVKTPLKRDMAEQRRKDIEVQLTGSKYGIAYVDATEKITQLNRSVENNLLGQIEFLTNQLYGQLGITDEVMKGTANEETMLNYYNRTIEPILAAICDSLKRTFLSKTARSQGHSIEYFSDPFRLTPVNKIAEMADSLTRNAILSSNEFRTKLGMKPSNDPSADELSNKNLYKDGGSAGAVSTDGSEQDAIVEDLFSSLEKQIDEIVGGTGEEAEEPEEPEEDKELNDE